MLQDHYNTKRNTQRYRHHREYHVKRGHTEPGDRANKDAMMEAAAEAALQKQKLSHRHTFRAPRQAGRRHRRGRSTRRR
jgi:hypothetical protein